MRAVQYAAPNGSAGRPSRSKNARSTYAATSRTAPSGLSVNVATTAVNGTLRVTANARGVPISAVGAAGAAFAPPTVRMPARVATAAPVATDASSFSLCRPRPPEGRATATVLEP
jgi:hypothetical protein